MDLDINSKISENVDIEKDVKIQRTNIGEYTKIYRGAFLRNSNIKENCFVSDEARVDNSEMQNYSRVGRFNHIYYTKLGRHTYTGQNTVIMKTNIGNFTSIAWNVTIGAPEHDYKRITSHTCLYNPYDNLNNGEIPYDRFEKKCEIGNDVWIGAGSCILRGVTIGDGAVIGANSTVTQDVPPYAIVVGTPAKIIKYRFDEKTIKGLLDIKWWNLSDEIIKENIELIKQNPNEEVLNKLKKYNIQGE